MVAVAPPSVVDEVTYHPHGAAASIFGCRDKEVLIEGPAGTGKTYACLWKVHLCALKYPGMRAIVLRKTLASLTASALVTYVERVLGSGEYGVIPFGGSKLRPTAFRYPNGSEVVVGGLDKATKIMSAEYDLAYVNEATELSQADWESITSRLRYGVMPYQQLLADCNPGPYNHWLNQRAEAGRVTRFRSRHEENPALYDERRGEWTPMGRRYLETLENLSGVLYQRLRLGKWVAAEGLVYPDFDPQRQVRDVRTTDWGGVIGVDAGVRNPSAILTVRHVGEARHLEHEIYRAGMGNAELLVAVRSEADRLGPLLTSIQVDPSAAGLITDLRGLGYPVHPANNAILDGIREVTTQLAHGMTVDPSCQDTIAEFEAYAYPDRRQDTDKPVDANNHAMDALRYALMYWSGQPVATATSWLGPGMPEPRPTERRYGEDLLPDDPYQDARSPWE